MAVTDDLRAEITSILGCPYPASLKKLEQILLDCSARDVQTWAIDHPCSIEPLASLVLQAFRVWDYTETIIAKLCLSRRLQEAFLNTDPQLLDVLLQDAHAKDEKQQDATTTAAACIALLSHRLPKGMVLPAMTQTFLVRLVERGISSPSASTLRPIYTVLKGCSMELLCALPNSRLEAFAEGIFQVLRSTTTFEGEPIYLLCLSILRLMAQTQGSDDDHDKTVRPNTTSEQATALIPRHALHSARAYFAEPKASKTLQLVVLEVMLAYKSEDEHAEIVTSSLEMAVDLVQSMDKATRTDWAKSNAAMVRKIFEKASRSALSAEVRLLGVAFVKVLVGSNFYMCNLPPGQVEAILLAALETSVGGDEAQGAIQLYVGSFALTFNGRAIIHFLMHMLDTALGVKQPSLVNIHKAVLLAEALIEQVIQCPPFRSLVMGVLGEAGSHELRSRFMGVIEQLETADMTAKAHSTKACSISHTWAVRHLISRLQHLLVCTVIPGLQQTLCISKEELWRLLQSGEAVGPAPPACEHSHRKNRQASFRALPTYETDQRDQAWPDRLRHVLERDMNDRYASIVRLMTEACEDLQARCDNVEKPLRDERARCEELTAVADTLRKHLTDVHTLLAEQKHQLQSQQAEQHTTSEQLADAETAKTALYVRIEELEECLAASHYSAATTLQEVRGEHDQRILELQGEQAAMQEDFEEMQEALKLKTGKLEAMEGRLIKALESLDAEQGQAQALAKELEVERRKLSASEDERRELRQELERMNNTEADLEHKLRAQKEQLAGMTANLEELREKAELDVTAAVEERQALVAAHSNAIEEMKMAQQQAEEDSIAKMEQLRSELDREHADHKESSARVQEIEEQRAQDKTLVDQLKADLEESQTALAEAQEMRRRLMQAMGLPVSSSAAPPTDRRRSQRAATDPAICDAITPGSSTAGQRPLKSATSSPTPKRIKPRVPGPVSMTQRLQHSKVRMPSTKRKDSSPRRRPALQEASGNSNRRTTIAAFSGRSSRNRAPDRSALSELGFQSQDLDFHADELLSGTPALMEPEDEGYEDDQAYDGTTADF